MKKTLSIFVRIVLTVVAGIVAGALDRVMVPVGRVVSAEQALNQMSNSDAGYIQAIVGMSAGKTIENVVVAAYILLLLVLWIPVLKQLWKNTESSQKSDE